MRRNDPLQHLRTWLHPFLEALGDQRRKRWPELYLQGLMAPLQRKSIEPIAALVAPKDLQQVHHFVSASTWDDEPLEPILAQKANHLLGGAGSVLVVDDTSLLKFGTNSVGVARQSSGQAGKITNCQTLVSLTLAKRQIGVLAALRLYLPSEWTSDPERCRRAGVPEECIAYRSKLEIALDEIDRILLRGVEFDLVLADAGYGKSKNFRQALTERSLTWAVGIDPSQKVYPLDVTLAEPVLRYGSRGGRPQKHPTPGCRSTPAERFLAALPWREVTWSKGTKGNLRGRFVVARVRAADGPLMAKAQHLPGEEAWLVGEERSSGARRYYFTNHPPDTKSIEVIRDVKKRWVCEQAHREAKDELGLDHYEGRSWRGLHHHALLVMMALLFLQTCRLQAVLSICSRDVPPAPSLPSVLREVMVHLWTVMASCPCCGRPSG